MRAAGSVQRLQNPQLLLVRQTGQHDIAVGVKRAAFGVRRGRDEHVLGTVAVVTGRPSRSLVNAMRFPSGDQTGSWPSASVRRVGLVPSTGMTKMTEWPFAELETAMSSGRRATRRAVDQPRRLALG